MKVAVVFGVFLFSYCLAQRQQLESGPHVLLAVSSLVNRDRVTKVVEERQLEIQWFNAPKGDQLWVGLYTHDPIENPGDPVDQAFISDHPDGFYTTKVIFPKQTFDPSALSSKCLGYWAALKDGDEYLSSTCIRAQPHWMHDIRNSIKSKTLLDLFLPGTHNSAATQPYHPDTYTRVTKYQMCQEEDIWNQLVYGIRYLDVRAAYYSGSGDNFWVSHDMFKMEYTIRRVLKELKKFLDATNEIVILDFHRFNAGFSTVSKKKRHNLLINMIKEELGDYLITPDMGLHTPLEELWQTNKRVLVSYAENDDIRGGRVFQGVRHLWANTDQADKLETYLSRNECNRPFYLTSAMAQLTAEPKGVILDDYKGLRTLADKVNRDVTKWYKERWWQCARIVSTDFFMGNNIIQVAIESNKKR